MNYSIVSRGSSLPGLCPSSHFQQTSRGLIKMYVRICHSSTLRPVLVSYFSQRKIPNPYKVWRLESTSPNSTSHSSHFPNMSPRHQVSELVPALSLQNTLSPDNKWLTSSLPLDLCMKVLWGLFRPFCTKYHSPVTLRSPHLVTFFLALITT